MRKILFLIFVSSLAFADADNPPAPEQPKSGFDNMTPLGKAAFVAASPIFVVGGVVYFVADTVMNAPFDAAKWIINKASTPEETALPDLNLSEK
jgi:hypothetical protein